MNADNGPLVNNQSYGADARRLLMDRSSGVLSTHSVDVAGYPFGSVVPYCIDTDGFPMLLLSDLAQHTKNVKAVPCASLTVQEPDDGDVQSVGRVTCIGDVLAVNESAVHTIQRYYRFFPESEEYHKRLDFAFYRLQIIRVGYIGGFGGLHWIRPDEFLCANPFPPEVEQSIVNHMNEDHVEAMEKYCRLIEHTIPERSSPQMVGVDAEGFHLRVGAQLVRLYFSRTVTDPMDVRAELTALANQRK